MFYILVSNTIFKRSYDVSAISSIRLSIFLDGLLLPGDIPG